MLAALVSAAHILSIVVATSVAIARVRALRATLDAPGIQRLFFWDNLAGLVAIPLLGSGLWRALAGLDKPTDFYLHSNAFHLKMSLILGVVALEMWPMITFIRWRVALKKGKPIDTHRARLFSRILGAQLALYALIIPTAAMMARGIGYRPPAPGSPACAVEQIMLLRCATCHGPANQQAGMDLIGDPHTALVDRPSSTWPAERRVVPGDPGKSLLIKKLRGTQGPLGLRMPLTGELPPTEIDTIESWVAAGAPRCAE